MRPIVIATAMWLTSCAADPASKDPVPQLAATDVATLAIALPLPTSTSTPPPLNDSADAESELFTPPQSAPHDALAPRPSAPDVTVLIPVPPLPADLAHSRPTPPPADEGDDPHDHDAEPTAPVDIVAAWIAAVYTGRYDDPVELAAESLHPLAVNDDVAVAALASVTPLDADGGEARWPYLVSVSDDGGGWWVAEILVKTTCFGQVGPATTSATVRVHVDTDLLVDDWEIVE